MNNFKKEDVPIPKGTRIIFSEEAEKRRTILNTLITLAKNAGFKEISLPSMDLEEIYTNKAGEEIKGQMYLFDDKKGRKLCLRPEGTATVQLLANTVFRNQKDIKLWYFEKCWRYEQPQAGRYREFFQFGLEILNPSKDYTDELIALAELMLNKTTDKPFTVHKSVKRGLSYYTGNGFEISMDCLGAQKQVVGGGAYKEGIGFAIGFDRVILSTCSNDEAVV